MRRGFALIWTLLTALIAGAAAYFAYGAGWAAAIATKLPSGAAAPPYYWGYYGWHPWGFGFLGIFGFLLFLLILFVLLRLAFFGRRHHGWGGPRRFEEWHRMQHEGSAPPPTTV